MMYRIPCDFKKSLVFRVISLFKCGHWKLVIKLFRKLVRIARSFKLRENDDREDYLVIFLK